MKSLTMAAVAALLLAGGISTASAQRGGGGAGASMGTTFPGYDARLAESRKRMQAQYMQTPVAPARKVKKRRHYR